MRMRLLNSKTVLRAAILGACMLGVLSLVSICNASAEVIPISVGKTVSASTAKGDDAAGYGNDGLISHRWQAADKTNEQWWEVDLGQSYDLARVDIAWYGTRADRKYKYRIEISDTGETYNLVFDNSGETAGSAAFSSDIIDARGRYVRIVFPAGLSYYSPSFHECKIYTETQILELPPIDISPLVCYYDKNLASIQNFDDPIRANNKYGLKGSIVNNSGSAFTGKLLLVMYDSSNELQGYSVTSVSVAESDKYKIVSGIGFVSPDTSSTEGFYVKAFLWDSLEEMNPLASISLLR